MAARIATMATTATTSISVKPSVAPVPSALPARDVLCRACSTFRPIRAVGKEIVGPAFLSGRTIDVSIAPGIGRNLAALQVRAVPGRDVAGPAHQRRQSFRAARVAPGIEEEQVERAAEAFDLDLGGLGFRFGEIVEHAWADD